MNTALDTLSNRLLSYLDLWDGGVSKLQMRMNEYGETRARWSPLVRIIRCRQYIVTIQQGDRFDYEFESDPSEHKEEQ